MLKRLWTAIASACSYLWARLSPDVLDTGVPSKRPFMVLIEKAELDELRADLEESKRNGDLLDESREECRNLGVKSADLQRQLNAMTEQNRGLLRTVKAQAGSLAELRSGMNSIGAIWKAHEGRHAGTYGVSAAALEAVHSLGETIDAGCRPPASKGAP